MQIGAEQSCSCKTSPELCIHILFVMLKIYRIPPTNPVVWQQSLLDDEITQILTGRLQRQASDDKPKPAASSSSGVERRAVDDVCPICYDDMNEDDLLV